MNFTKRTLNYYTLGNIACLASIEHRKHGKRILLAAKFRPKYIFQFKYNFIKTDKDKFL